MSYPFDRPMPERPIRQKHPAHGHKSDNNYGFLRSLSGNQGVDVDLRWVWRNPKRRTKAAGGAAFALHGTTPAADGYEHIMDGGRCRPMTKAERRRPHSKWSVTGVQRWRRGPSARSARPRMYAEMVAYVKRHGGTIVGELKSRIFATSQWIVDQLVDTARRLNHAPWFKALANMWGLLGKATRVAAAGGWLGVIFGKHVKGRSNRVARGNAIIRDWPADVRARTRIW